MQQYRNKSINSNWAECVITMCVERPSVSGGESVIFFFPHHFQTKQQEKKKKRKNLKNS